MIVHFDCPSPLAAQNMDYYMRVVGTIKAEGHEVANVWGQSSYSEMADSLLDQDDWEVLCRQTLKALEGADVVILDASQKSVFGIGYQAAIALQHNKRVLLLLDRDGNGSFTSGLRHDLLFRAYKGEYVVAITKFLKETGR